MFLTQLLSLIGIVLVIATLPLLAELLVLSVAALFPAPPSGKFEAESELPPISVLIPAHNEEVLIGRCVQSLMSCSGTGTEVVVVAHNCTDATAAEAEAAGARVMVLNDSGQTGKSCALNYGFEAILTGPSQGVLVIDADSAVDSGLITAVRRGFLAGAQALQCRYEVNNSGDSQRTRLMALAFCGFNVIRPLGRARIGLSAGIVGNGFALHRDVLTRIPYNAHSIVEDLEYHLALVRAGIRVEFIDTVAVRGEMPVTSKNAQTQRARWEGGRMRMMRRWAPALTVDVLRGRVRLVEPLLDLLALPIASEATLLLIAALLPVPWLRVYALGAFSVLLFHVMAASVRGPGIWGTIRALLAAPAYVLWKLWILPEIWCTSRANAAWVRTERESPVDGN
jgi:cellulose synthase/poly-beta-1,6-N-acetylglucosamine synthase-like glycosyltransferase